MKVKKLENTLLIVSSVSVFVAILAGLFAFISCEEQIVSTGFGMFVAAFKALFSFNFAEAPVLLLFAMFAVSVICLVIWMIVLIKKKVDGESWFKFALSFVFILFVVILGAAMFAGKVTVNGEDMSLFTALKTIEDNVLARVLGVVSVGSAYLVLMLVTLYAFLNLGMTFVVGPDYREAEIKLINAENNQHAKKTK